MTESMPGDDTCQLRIQPTTVCGKRAVAGGHHMLRSRWGAANAKAAAIKVKVFSASRVLAVVGVLAMSFAAAALAGGGTAAAAPITGCDFPNPAYHHVVWLQFDNVHLRRDNPNVPSDIEQMPALHAFLTQNGSLLSDDHTILIAHTAGGLMSTATGLYPSGNGIGVSNSYQEFTGESNETETAFQEAFTYWTDPTADGLPNMITAGQKNTPAPWVTFTRAGCSVGAFSYANIELENTGTYPGGDVTSVFQNGTPGIASPQGAIAHSTVRGLASADLEGIAIHCSLTASQPGGPCSQENGGVSDKLPQEPGGYEGFNGLFGAISVNPLLAGKPATTNSSSPEFGGKPVPSVAPPVNDVYDYKATIAGNPPTQPVQDESGNAGFPGFDPTPAQALGYVASMQEHNIPVTMAYIADAHDDHSGRNNFNAYGPGQKGYEEQLKEWNQGFAAFFDRLGQDGINHSNTLFVITVDEGDHFAGGTPINPACNGVSEPCEYTPAGTTVNEHSVGEQDVDINNALEQETSDPLSSAFNIHEDDAPTFYLLGNPGSDEPGVRQLERDVAKLKLTNQINGQSEPVLEHLADRADERILHMINSDPNRTPTFTLFGNPAFYYQEESPFGYTCPEPTGPPGCPVVNGEFAWNHGGDQPEVGNTWLGLVGPTVRQLGQTGSAWTDHTDVQPTVMAALGLHSDYAPEGRVITQALDPSTLPREMQHHLFSLQALGAIYKQLDAPFGQFGQDSETVSTRAVQTASSGETVYEGFDQQLEQCATAREALAGEINGLLTGVEFGGAHVSEPAVLRLAIRGAWLIAQMHWLSQSPTPPRYPVCG